MSGFLDRIVCNTLGLNEKVMPKIPSLFEPKSDTLRVFPQEESEPFQKEEIENVLSHNSRDGFSRMETRNQGIFKEDEEASYLGMSIPVPKGQKTFMGSTEGTNDTHQNFSSIGMPTERAGSEPNNLLKTEENLRLNYPLQNDPILNKPSPTENTTKLSFGEPFSCCEKGSENLVKKADLPSLSRQPESKQVNSKGSKNSTEHSPMQRNIITKILDHGLTNSPRRSNSMEAVGDREPEPTRISKVSGYEKVGDQRENKSAISQNKHSSKIFPAQQTNYERELRKDIQAIKAALNGFKGGVQAKSTTSDSTVHVTIGRVEVKAVSGKAPTKRMSHSSHAVMPLQDYLAFRAQGKIG